MYVKRSTRGRQPVPVTERKRFALRLYACILDECGSFESFKKLLGEKARVRESTVRNWIPPLTRLNVDPVRGKGVLKRDWEALHSPDFASVVELAALLNVSVDYLLGSDVPRRLTDRQPVGELSKALFDHLFTQYPQRAAAGLPFISFRVLAEALDGRRRPIAGADAEMEIDPQAVLRHVEDLVFQTAEKLQEQQNAEEASAWSEKISDVAHRIRALLTHHADPRRRQLLRKLLHEVGQVAIESDGLRAVLMLNTIAAEVRLAEAELTS
jgi:hypothetical protein